MSHFKEHTDQHGKILYWIPENKADHINSSKVLAMDLDWTIIRPIKGKIFPVDKDDWDFWAMNPEIIKDYIHKGYKFVIITNQAGLLKEKSKLTIEDFKDRWENSIYPELKKLGITSAYLLVSLYDDFYRKPCTGIWDFLEAELNDSIKIDKKKSLYVGDMAGREKDFAATDLEFALNIGIDFEVPEVFYYNKKYSKIEKYTTEFLIRKLKEDEKVFIPSRYLDEVEDKKKEIETRNKDIVKNILTEVTHHNIVIMFVGSPASGKTTFYRRNFANDGKIAYMSNDTFKGTPAKFTKEVGKKLADGSSVVIDNTNGTKSARAKIIDVAGKAGIRVIVIHFDTPKPVIMHMNEIRSKIAKIAEMNGEELEKPPVPDVAIHTYFKKFEEPDLDEGIEKIYKVEYLPVFDEAMEDKFRIIL
jgi:bifunctional polynucleotide phosphatase/kinase